MGVGALGDGVRRSLVLPSERREKLVLHIHTSFSSIQTRTDTRRVPDAELRVTAGPQQRLLDGC